MCAACLLLTCCSLLVSLSDLTEGGGQLVDAGVDGTDTGVDVADGNTDVDAPDVVDASSDATEEPEASTDASADAEVLDADILDADTDAALPYPTRSAYRIKGVRPDGWANLDDISKNNAGSVQMYFFWAFWEPTKKAPPCDAGVNEVAYDGHCFAVPSDFDDAVREWTARGVAVTATVAYVPAWARTKRVCSPAAAGYEYFCVPDDPADFARFAGFLAHRYDGKQGHGRIADFGVHFLANDSTLFDIGCGQGTPCDTSTWIGVYADNYNAAYDRIVAEQSTAKVFVALNYRFLGADDATGATPSLSGPTFLTGLAPRLAPRAWRVSIVALSATTPLLDADPMVTLGNVGVVSGWLWKTFPNVPSALDVQITEGGINAAAPGSTSLQSTGVCTSFRNVLGTPGVSTFNYARMKDFPEEVPQGVAVGLHTADGTARPAWDVWANANRDDLVPPQLSCGFEDLPYVRLTRTTYQGFHWTSTRAPPPNFTAETSAMLLRDEAPGTVLLFECRLAANRNFVTRDRTCSGGTPYGPVGYAYTSPVAGTVPLYRCFNSAIADHFVSVDPSCEGMTVGEFLGYAKGGT